SRLAHHYSPRVLSLSSYYPPAPTPTYPLSLHDALPISVIVYYSFLQDIATSDERDAVSTRGWAIGYLGGGLALALQLAFYLGRDAFGISESTAVRICLLSTGVWWAVFTIIPLRTLPQPRAAPGAHGNTGTSILTAGFKELVATIRSARRVPLTLAFLGVYLIYADGVATVVGVSAQ